MRSHEGLQGQSAASKWSHYGTCQGGSNEPTSPEKPLAVQRTQNTKHKPCRGHFFRPIYHITSIFLFPAIFALFGSPESPKPNSWDLQPRGGRRGKVGRAKIASPGAAERHRGRLPPREGPGTVPSPPQSDLRASNGLESQRGGAHDLTTRRPFCAPGSRA